MDEIQLINNRLELLDCRARFLYQDDAGFYYSVSFWSARCAKEFSDFYWCVGSGAAGRLRLRIMRNG